MSGWEEPDLRGSGARRWRKVKLKQWTWKRAARMMYFCRFIRMLSSPWFPVGSFIKWLFKSLCGKQKFKTLLFRQSSKVNKQHTNYTAVPWLWGMSWYLHFHNNSDIIEWYWYGYHVSNTCDNIILIIQERCSAICLTLISWLSFLLHYTIDTSL